LVKEIIDDLLEQLTLWQTSAQKSTRRQFRASSTSRTVFT
jgi:hypothetical protein